ncbi:CinA family protein, partial [Arthrospira platensis SPKY1]|nr:CinA family protein [Arthrospira platensis SPKY1]
MPGVPYEMKFLMAERVWPKVGERFGLDSAMYRSYIRTAGIGESNLSQELLPDIPRFLADERLGLAFLPSAGEVKLRVTALAETFEEAQKLAMPLETYIRQQAASVIYSFDRNEELPEAVGRVLRDQGKTLAVAESCTGGSIA